MGIVSKLKLDHPALGTAGGAGLHASIESLYTKIGDNMNSRWFAINDFDQAETFDLDHSFSTDIANLSYDIWVYNGTDWVQLDETTTPLRSAFTVIEKVGSEPNILQITNNTGGDNLTAAVSVILKTTSLKDDVKDVDVANIADGQGLMYNSTTKKYERATKNYIGSATLDASAVLQADSTTKGFLPPRMTQAQRDAIVSPVNGLIIHNTTTNLVNFFNGTSWVAISSSSNATPTVSGVVTSYTPVVAASVNDVNNADYPITTTDGYETILVTTGASNRTVTLPLAADNDGRKITIKKVDSGVGTLILDGNGAETIDGATTYTLTSRNQQLTVVCNGTSWSIISGKFADSNNTGSVTTSAQTFSGVKTFSNGINLGNENLTIYDEGTFTATWVANANLDSTPAATTIYFVRIGKFVHCEGQIIADATTGSQWSAYILRSALPHTPREGVQGVGYKLSSVDEKMAVIDNGTQIHLRAYGNAGGANNTWYFSFSYQVS